MRRVAIVLPALIVVVAASASFLALSRTNAVQDPTLSLDMVTAGNTYSDPGAIPAGDNSMTVGTIDNCFTDNHAVFPHNLTAHLIVQNVEDLAGAQARFNFDSNTVRVTNFISAPFQDTSTIQNVGFVNLPLDPALGNNHRDPTAQSDFSQPNTALVNVSYLGDNTLPISPDTPPKSTPDDTSYSAPTGGIVGTVVIQVQAAAAGQSSLRIDLDDGNPTPPGTSVDIFDGSGIIKRNLDGFRLGDGFIGVGTTCVAGAQETAPPATPTPTGGAATPTPTPTATTGGGGGGGRTATPTGAGARTATPRVSPAALPPTGTTPDGDSSTWLYALLLGAAITASTSGVFGLYRLRKR